MSAATFFSLPLARCSFRCDSFADEAHCDCSKLHKGLYSWAGAVSEGSYFGDDYDLFLSILIAGAEGSYALNLATSVTVATTAGLVVGQSASVHGSAAAMQLVWDHTSSQGAAFSVGVGATLEIHRLTVASASGLAFEIAASVTITMSGLRLQSGDGSATSISCTALASGVGEAGLTCVDTGQGGVVVSGPLSISTSGAGFGMG